MTLVKQCMIVNVSYIIPSIHYSVFAITCFYIAIPLCSVQSLQILIFLQQISRIATILSCPYFFLAYFKVSELPTHAIGDGMDFGSQLLLYLYIKLIIAYIQSLAAILDNLRFCWNYVHRDNLSSIAHITLMNSTCT